MQYRKKDCLIVDKYQSNSKQGIELGVFLRIWIAHTFLTMIKSDVCAYLFSAQTKSTPEYGIYVYN